MIVSNLNVISVPIMKSETDAPLVINSDGKLTGSIIFQDMETIARRNLQIVKRYRIVQEFKPSDCALNKIRR